ncbi:scaffolding protein [Serratia ureilytica]|uniref:scaffolding protein n=1 Tax=Serratia ureilytica TaxID=300181 RepID=UPI00384DCF0A
MDNQADQQSPEVELEEYSSEQIPDDAGQHSDDEGEQSQNTEQQQESEDDDEEEFYFGDEMLGSPSSEEGADHGLVKHLRGTIKEKERELKELRRLSQQQPQQQVINQPPQMPKLSDEGIDYDEEIFQKKLDQWSKDSAQYQIQQQAKSRQEQQQKELYQQKLTSYQQRAKSVKVAGYQDAEQLVMDEVPVEIQNAILFEAEKPEMVVLALGRNAELRRELASATNPIAVGRLIERIESKAKTMPKPKSTAATVPEVKGGNGAVINNLDKLKAKALETGDWSPYFAAKRSKK